MDRHAIIRTSPKGEKFIGTCMKCGEKNLTIADMVKHCANVSGMSDEEALIRALEGGENG